MVEGIIRHVDYTDDMKPDIRDHIYHGIAFTLYSIKNSFSINFSAGIGKFITAYNVLTKLPCTMEPNVE